jgi:hypothetical protein
VPAQEQIAEFVDPSHLIQAMDSAHAGICSGYVRLFSLIATIDRLKLWASDGAYDTAHWVAMRHGVSWWRADRWVSCARALEHLPRIREAFGAGELSVDQAVELVRLATPETESELLAWGRDRTPGAIRRRAELERRREVAESTSPQESRYLKWWYFDEGRRMALEGELPAAEGAQVASALEEVARTIPAMPGEYPTWSVDQRRADALVALCSARLAQHPDPDRATVIVHARLDQPDAELNRCELEGGPVIHPETARRMLCAARVQVVLEDPAGNPVRVGRMRRDPPEWMLRELKYRDRECRFPGCGRRGYLQAHHITWWKHGGRTDLDNLVLVCSFHHKLVHEYGWRLIRRADGEVQWFYPDGTRYRAGPAPPREPVERQRALSVAAF